MSEFTGERLIPGGVDADLWNEHISRYAFAASFCRGSERVIDAGCGTGYGSAYLGGRARSVLGLDISDDAIRFAKKQYGTGRVRFAVGACEALPVDDEDADLIVAFEVIEHLAGWHRFLEDCYRALAPGGLLIVSTPNKAQYAQSRAGAGPNPYHVHEFECEEFETELGHVFPFVTLYGQNHTESIVFSTPAETVRAAFGSLRCDNRHAAYFVAVCGKRERPASASFVYVPEAANVLLERERHIALLRGELEAKDAELEVVHQEQATLVKQFRSLNAELEASNAWAVSLQSDLDTAANRVVLLQDELLDAQRKAQAEIDRITEEREQERKVWAERSGAMEALVAELARCVDALHEAERTVVERTQWAQRRDARLALFENSRWIRLGRKVNLGPPKE